MASDKPRALVLNPFEPLALRELKTRADVMYESWLDTRRLLSPDELTERIESGNLQILVVEADFVFDEVIEKTNKLRFIGVCRASVSNVDIDAATKHGVLVVNTPARNAVSVAELTVGLMLSLARHIPEANCLVKSGQWVDPVGPYIFMRGLELAGMVGGIVGFGAIGTEVATRLLAFDMDVVVYDPHRSPEEIDKAGARQVELHELVKESDFITIHCPVSPETAGLIGAQEISLMKPATYLINTAGWDIVDETALFQALQERQIAGAAFDIYQTHPLSAQSPLLKLDNVVLTPHIGGATDGTVTRYSRMMVEDIIRFLDGKRPKNLVNPEAWQYYVR